MSHLQPKEIGSVRRISRVGEEEGPILCRNLGLSLSETLLFHLLYRPPRFIAIYDVSVCREVKVKGSIGHRKVLGLSPSVGPFHVKLQYSCVYFLLPEFLSPVQSLQGMSVNGVGSCLSFLQQASPRLQEHSNCGIWIIVSLICVLVSKQ